MIALKGDPVEKESADDGQMVMTDEDYERRRYLMTHLRLTDDDLVLIDSDMDLYKLVLRRQICVLVSSLDESLKPQVLEHWLKNKSDPDTYQVLLRFVDPRIARVYETWELRRMILDLEVLETKLIESTEGS